MKKYKVSVDIGGTFTDVVCYDKKSKNYYYEKVLTTPGHLESAVIDGIGKVIDDFSEIEYIIHGTTSGLNAFLERKGAKTALIVTKGFRDIYEIGRTNRPEIYNIQYKRPKRLVQRKDIYEISERINADGGVKEDIDFDELRELIELIKKENYDSIAVCLLHAYKNTNHENKIAEVLQASIPNIDISLSSDVAREWREYERTSTTVLNAYISPIVKKYLRNLEEKLIEKGYNNELYIMQSNGGAMTAKAVGKVPIQTLISGPAGGIVGSQYVSDNNNLICIDMGGTSFDVSLIVDGELDISTETVLEGFPILSPMVNLYTVGSGGGSIAWLEGGGLRVGPKSAGATPGPACYPNGGTEPTVTDANLVLGRLDENSIKSSGGILLNKEKSIEAIKKLGDQLNLDTKEVAEGILKIANSKMADAIRALTVKRGIDPRNFTLVAYGGAGPMHAVELAELLEIKEVLVPRSSGTFSATGMFKTDIRHDSVQNFLSDLKTVDLELLEKKFKKLDEEVRTVIQNQNIKDNQITLNKSLDMRYIGQEYTVNVPLPLNTIEKESIHKLYSVFNEMYLDRYGHNNQKEIIEIVNLRVSGISSLAKTIDMEIGKLKIENTKSDSFRYIYWKGKEIKTNLYYIKNMKYQDKIKGPAMVQDKSTTLFVPPLYEALMKKNGNIEIKKY